MEKSDQIYYADILKCILHIVDTIVLLGLILSICASAIGVESSYIYMINFDINSVLTASYRGQLPRNPADSHQQERCEPDTSTDKGNTANKMLIFYHVYVDLPFILWKV